MPAAKPDLPQWYTVPEVAAILRVSPATVRRLARDGHLEAIDMASPYSVRPRLVVPPDALDRFRESRRIATTTASQARRCTKPQPVKRFV